MSQTSGQPTLLQSGLLCLVLSDDMSCCFGEIPQKKAVITPITIFPE